jgi:uridine kinase
MKSNQLSANDFESGKKVIINEINRLLKNKSRLIVAIDGMAASGKTTLAESLRKEFDAEVVHMDDFFLQDYQRTQSRLNEIGGNIDYERFISEILNQITMKQEELRYNIYNCQTKSMKEVSLNLRRKVIIVEGAYALREEFRKIYDFKVLITIDPSKQIERLKRRNINLIDKFVGEWIPKENKYIDNYRVKDFVDVVINV